MNSLTDSLRKEVITNDSNTVIVFGSMQTQKAIMKATFPVMIANKKSTITSDVIDGELPLLLSKSAMKKAGVVFNVVTDVVEVLSKSMKLKTSSSGYYLLPLFPNDGKYNALESTLALMATKDVICEKNLQKLHVQLAHCSKNALERLLRNADLSFDSQKIGAVIEKCHVCAKNSKPDPKPVVGLPMATKWNEIVAMDLHQLDSSSWYLHIMCIFSKFSVDVIIQRKTADLVIKSFTRFRNGVFGQPQHGLLFNNGGEFSNIQMHNLCEKLNIQIKTTAAYSPFSNGCLERHNATITNIYEKVRMDHPTLYLDTCLAYACFAKDNLYNNSGFTPAQIALGYSPRLPCNVENELSALDDKLDMSTVVGNHLSAMHSARTQYLKSGSCERV